MLVLDADSLMTGDAVVKLAAIIEKNPDFGLVQTVPISIGRNTLFARLQQFAGRLYGPMLATGLSFWHRGVSNFWGHNAIIRIRAFIESAGLPVLPGKPPFGGQILSHDFVEAALLNRAGWRVCMVPDLAGSYEEIPPGLIDFAMRDRRWAQGNLQHSRVLFASGLHWMSRVHMAMGIMAYMWHCLAVFPDHRADADATVDLDGARFLSAWRFPPFSDGAGRTPSGLWSFCCSRLPFCSCPRFSPMCLP